MLLHGRRLPHSRANVDHIAIARSGIWVIDAPVFGALCFVDAELPLLRSLSLDGVALQHPRGLAKRIEAGPVRLTPAQVAGSATALARQLPPA